ncbi:MAG: T9SS type A sorting domain-containing protein [Crocinitomicaceae bacterium]|nr:T9SS type A sorting domain-containing protein [Crocinitomicaceae bacterium]
MNRSTSIPLILFVVLFLPFTLFSNSVDVKNRSAYAILDSINCPPADVQFTDTTYTLDQNGFLEFNLSITIDGVLYWCTYNPTTGITTSNLPSYQMVLGVGTYSDAMLVYNFSSGPGCRGIEDTLIFQVPPGTSHCDNGNEAGNNGNGNGTNGNGSGNNGNGNGSNGNGSGNNGNGTGSNGNGTGNIKGIENDTSPLVSSKTPNNGVILLYPNPTTEFIMINIDPGNDNVQIVLSNNYGFEQLNELIETDQQKIDVSVLERGVYFYSIIKNGSILSTGSIILE